MNGSVFINLFRLILNEPTRIVLDVVLWTGSFFRARVELDIIHVELLGEGSIHLILLEEMRFILLGGLRILHFELIDLSSELLFKKLLAWPGGIFHAPRGDHIVDTLLSLDVLSVHFKVLIKILIEAIDVLHEVRLLSALISIDLSLLKVLVLLLEGTWRRFLDHKEEALILLDSGAEAS